MLCQSEEASIAVVISSSSSTPEVLNAGAFLDIPGSQFGSIEAAVDETDSEFSSRNLPKNREYFLLTFMLMFTILIVMFIAWRVKRLLSFLTASLISTLICTILPVVFMSNYTNCQYAQYYESSITSLNSSTHLQFYSIIFLPVCLLLRLLLTKWHLFLYTFTLLGSPWIAVYGLAQYLQIILYLQDIEKSTKAFQSLQLYMYFFAMITFSGIWIFIFSVHIFNAKKYWKFWKIKQNYSSESLEDLEKASLPEEEADSSLLEGVPKSLDHRKCFTKSHTTTRLVKFSHQWTIEEFIRCDHRAGAPKYLDSMQFTSPDNEEMRFYLRLYPRGRGAVNRAGESAVSLYLHYLPCGTVKEVTIGFVCSIVDKGGAKCDQHERRDLFNADQDFNGWDNFIYRSTLLNSRFLLPLDKLTINCEVSYAIDDLFTFETIV